MKLKHALMGVGLASASLLVGAAAFAQNSPIARRPSNEASSVRANAPPVSAPNAVPSAAMVTPPATVPVPETQAARALARLDELETELASMTDRLDRLEADSARLKAENLRLSALIEAAQANGANGATATTPAATAAATSAATTAETTPSSDPATAPAASGTENPANPLRIAHLDPDASPATVLREARINLQTGRFDQAEGRLAALLAQWPEAPEAEEARWLLGESRYVQSLWAPAAEAYIAYLGASPDGRRVPEIYIRLAGAFRQLGDDTQRCRALGAFAAIADSAGPSLYARYTQEAGLGAACPADQ